MAVGKQDIMLAAHPVFALAMPIWPEVGHPSDIAHVRAPDRVVSNGISCFAIDHEFVELPDSSQSHRRMGGRRVPFLEHEQVHFVAEWIVSRIEAIVVGGTVKDRLVVVQVWQEA